MGRDEAVVDLFALQYVDEPNWRCIVLAGLHGLQALRPIGEFDVTETPNELRLVYRSIGKEDKTINFSFSATTPVEEILQEISRAVAFATTNVGVDVADVGDAFIAGDRRGKSSRPTE